MQINIFVDAALNPFNVFEVSTKLVAEERTNYPKVTKQDNNIQVVRKTQLCQSQDANEKKALYPCFDT